MERVLLSRYVLANVGLSAGDSVVTDCCMVTQIGLSAGDSVVTDCCMVNQIVSISVAQYQLSELSVLLTAKLAVCVACKCQCLVLPDADVCVRTCVRACQCH